MVVVHLGAFSSTDATGGEQGSNPVRADEPVDVLGNEPDQFAYLNMRNFSCSRSIVNCAARAVQQRRHLPLSEKGRAIRDQIGIFLHIETHGM